jgi:hypothetical protein
MPSRALLELSRTWPPATRSRPSGRNEWPEQKRFVVVFGIVRWSPVERFQV